jgi:hypothetical protein
LCRCAYYKGTPVLYTSKGVTAPGLSIFLENYFVFATPPKPFGDFDETWYKERSHCVDVHIIRGLPSNYFSGSYGLWTQLLERKTVLREVIPTYAAV